MEQIRLGWLSQSCEATLQMSQRKLMEIHGVRTHYHVAIVNNNN